LEFTEATASFGAFMAAIVEFAASTEAIIEFAASTVAIVARQQIRTIFSALDSVRTG
jgi:hypothetical protein